MDHPHRPIQLRSDIPLLYRRILKRKRIIAQKWQTIIAVNYLCIYHSNFLNFFGLHNNRQSQGNYLFRILQSHSVRLIDVNTLKWKYRWVCKKFKVWKQVLKSIFRLTVKNLKTQYQLFWKKMYLFIFKKISSFHTLIKCFLTWQIHLKHFMFAMFAAWKSALYSSPSFEQVQRLPGKPRSSGWTSGIYKDM